MPETVNTCPHDYPDSDIRFVKTFSKDGKHIRGIVSVIFRCCSCGKKIHFVGPKSSPLEADASQGPVIVQDGEDEALLLELDYSEFTVEEVQQQSAELIKPSEAEEEAPDAKTVAPIRNVLGHPVN